MDDLTDEALMTMFQRGNTAAFERLFERYRVPVFNFLYQLLNHQRESAEDLLQDIFIKLAGSRDLFDPAARFRPWLFAIARNHGLNHLRSRAVRQARQTIEFNERTPEKAELAASHGAPSDTLASLDEQARLKRMIDRLASPAREIFLLRAVDNMPHDDIAVVVRLNPATVRTHYHRARAQLAQWLTEEGEGS